MNRAKLILSLAINEKLIPSKQAANILVDFTLHRKKNPSLRLEDYLFAKHIFSAIQIGNLLALFNMMRISCKNCQTKVDIANMPIAGNWLCPSCRNNEFGLIKVKKVSPDAGEPFAKNIPKTISDQSISQLYKTAPGDSKSPYINKTSVAPANNLRADAIPENIAEPIMLDADHSSDAIDRTLLTEDQAIDMTVSDGYLIQTDSFDIKDSSDFNHERVLISKNNVSIDSQNKVRIADDDNETSDDNESQLILDNELFTPADNAQTLLQARKSTEKLPSNFSGIANRTAINMDGQEVVHKGITPESLEKGLSEGAILDGFEIRGILGRGGMGIVYNGHDLALNRKVAIKVLSPNILQNETQLKRFEIEAQACAQLEHQNVVNIYRFGTIYNHPYIVMQFVDGMSLNDIIKEDGYLPIEQVLDYLMQTARGLQEAHHRNIIHRDIKPDNLLVDTRGTIKIVDFGLAKQTTSDAKLSQSGYFLGTPAYISPE